jgi:hypothetical protein
MGERTLLVVVLGRAFWHRLEAFLAKAKQGGKSLVEGSYSEGTSAREEARSDEAAPADGGSVSDTAPA